MTKEQIIKQLKELNAGDFLPLYETHEILAGIINAIEGMVLLSKEQGKLASEIILDHPYSDAQTSQDLIEEIVKLLTAMKGGQDE